MGNYIGPNRFHHSYSEYHYNSDMYPEENTRDGKIREGGENEVNGLFDSTKELKKMSGSMVSQLKMKDIKGCYDY